MTPNPNIAKCVADGCDQLAEGMWLCRIHKDAWNNRPDCRPSQPVGESPLPAANLQDAARHFAVWGEHGYAKICRDAFTHTAHLEADLAAQKAGWAVAFRLGIHHQDRAEKLEARVAELEGALGNYGRHSDRCADHRYFHPDHANDCLCGFDAALTSAKKET